MFMGWLIRIREAKEAPQTLYFARTAWNNCIHEEEAGFPQVKNAVLYYLLEMIKTHIDPNYTTKPKAFLLDLLPHFRDPYGRDLEIRLKIYEVGRRIYDKSAPQVNKNHNKAKSFETDVIAYLQRFDGINEDSMRARGSLYFGRIFQAFGLPDDTEGWAELHREITASLADAMVPGQR
jgi:hypothetical protein